MTKDEALTMIVASIAMEELALSHIINAEGEKLQYVLGTLPGGRGLCSSTQEVLAVNKSVRELLDAVTQNQMLLKGKLERALEAGGGAPAPEPPCPGPCGPGPERPPCGGGPCSQRSAIQLVSRCGGFSWDSGLCIAWRLQGQTGRGLYWDENAPTRVRLDPKRAYALTYTINLRGPYLGGGSGAVLAGLTPRDAFTGLLPLYFSVKCLDCKPVTLNYTTTLFPQACPAPWAELSLMLNYTDSLFVDQASLSLVEL